MKKVKHLTLETSFCFLFLSENTQLQKILFHWLLMLAVSTALSSMSKFGVRTPLVPNKFNALYKDPNSNSFAVVF
jgi:hypothetical protein